MRWLCGLHDRRMHTVLASRTQSIPGGVIEGQMGADDTYTVFLDMFLNEKSDPSKECCNGARPVGIVSGFCFRRGTQCTLAS